MTREDIDRIATEYLNDTESTFEMEDVIELAIKALKLEEAIEDIKAEIEEMAGLSAKTNDKALFGGLELALGIIDKYIMESGEV